MSGGATSNIGKDADVAIAQISNQLYNMTKTLRAETIGQATEGMRTGTIQDRTGEIQQLVEGALQGGGNNVQTLTDAAAGGGQTRTPFAQRQIALARLEGEQKAGLVPADYIQSLIRTAEPIFMGQAPGIALEGLGGLADVASWQRAQNLQGQGQLIGGLAAGGGQAVGTGAGYYYQNRQLQAANTPARSSDPLYRTS